MTYLPKISSSSATPLKRSVSYTKLPEQDRRGKSYVSIPLYFILNTQLKSVSYLPKKNIVDLFSDEGPEAEELAIDSVQNGLQAVPLPWILAIKQLQELEIRKSFIDYMIFIISNGYHSLIKVYALPL